MKVQNTIYVIKLGGCFSHSLQKANVQILAIDSLKGPMHYQTMQYD